MQDQTPSSPLPPTRGGRRQGAGRPKGDSQLFAFRAGGELAQYINMHDNKSQFVVNCIETVRRQEASGDDAAALRGVGRAVPATRLSSVHLPLFDVRVVAGFPIPLDSDEAAQRIDLLKMLCPNPEATYLICVEGESMRDADIHTGDILVVDKSNRQPTPRQVAMFLAHKLTTKSLQEIGNAFKKKHSTVHHGAQTLQKRLDVESDLRRAVEQITSQLGRKLSDLT